ncbi:hypothetical protein LOTGIDRAFT_207583 [Lottia gigantea]|uniref:Trifunctional purine biosynthetic protein adenosine-3 n=1 Tax=Lottia gigantea TaxID=225164 RepID=V4B0F1_LOTGI|nr:hypothetical protein LOTGIDRAFT_207583 [Lottia gigantea]ESP03513.1 hypothetical protein LOTGIDRAFT_207583 [Lottia gigantea]
MSESVLLLGSGGREHALAWKLSQSKHVSDIYVAPGNAGTVLEGGKIKNITDLDIKQFKDVSNYCKEKKIRLVLVGPEDPLANGIADHLTEKEIPCFGPSKQAAEIEWSKDFAKKFMIRHAIPTAHYQSFTDPVEACEYINKADHKALVVKASGLAAGKGVIVAESREKACQAVNDILKDKKFGNAGDVVIVEDLIEGEEVSILAFTDGETVAMMPPAQDHKRLNEEDKGPNTGGMGAICPYSKICEEMLKFIKEEIIQKTVDGLKQEGRKYVGVIYAGCMITKSGPKVLEFNCRFGDPETQSILSLLKSDLYDICKACTNGTLSTNRPVFDTQHATVGIVLASHGYPDKYQKGMEIKGLGDADKLGVKVFHAGTLQKEDKIVTNGGRVLLVVATETDMESASLRALQGAAMIQFDKVFYRKDIGHHVLRDAREKPPVLNGLTYKDAGVDIEAGNSLVETIKPVVKDTQRPGCDAALGMFGAVFDIKAAGFKDPLLISGTDGVGTKLKVAHAVGNHDSIGVDLVAMCVNDILAHGAEPLFFLDYFASGKLHVDTAAHVIKGIADGCKEAGCALVGGETAEMPGLYHGEDYDLAGFTVGAVERENLLPRLGDIKPGDHVIGLRSSGLHSNGFSLVRRILEKKELRFDMPSPFKTGKMLGEDLLTPTKIYVKSLLPLIKEKKIKAFCHITGGGLRENIPRILPEHLSVTLDAKSWYMPAVFGWLSELGGLSEKEMAKTFNCGIGGIIIVNRSESNDIIKSLESVGESAVIVGTVEKYTGKEKLKIKNLEVALVQSWRHVPGVSRKKRVGVLISGSGTNLQSLIDYTRDVSNNSCAEILLVISNKDSVQGLKRAKQAGINTKVINHTEYKSREEFDEAVSLSLEAAGVEIVCLAGFMRILSSDFVKKWHGRLLNIHPSLLPSFKGANAHKLVLESNVRISGCTVHFVAEEVDAGAILIQESVPVYPNDTESTLSERVKKVEHKAFPKALELVASEAVSLKPGGKLEWKHY